MRHFSTQYSDVEMLFSVQITQLSSKQLLMILSDLCLLFTLFSNRYRLPQLM
jgi:hypothetical protein